MSKEAIEHYEAALKEAFPSGATGDVFHHWNEARKALAEQPAQQGPVALEQERKAFEEWIDSGFINKGHAAFHKFSDRDAYCIDEIQNKWKAWEERAKRTTPQAQPAQQQMPDDWFKGMPEEYRRAAWRIKEQPAQSSKPFDTHAAPGQSFDTHSRTPQQEPVGKKTRIGLVTSAGWDSLPVGTEFYTSPPASKPWVGLTDDEILYCVELENPKAIAEEVEAKLKEKNT